MLGVVLGGGTESMLAATTNWNEQAEAKLVIDMNVCAVKLVCRQADQDHHRDRPRHAFALVLGLGKPIQLLRHTGLVDDFAVTLAQFGNRHLNDLAVFLP